MMFTLRSTLAAVVLALWLLAGVDAAPQNRKKGKASATKQLTAQQQAAQVPGGISKATDGSTILDSTVTVKYVSILPSDHEQTLN